LREIARGERADGRRVRVRYRIIEIEDQMYVWSEEENRIIKREKGGWEGREGGEEG